jgi:pyrroline-5-carboxylate reductase
MLKNMNIGFIGGGNMSEAIMRGLLAGGVAPERIVASEPVAGRRDFLGGTYGVKVTVDNKSSVSASDVIILAVKPQVSAEVLGGLAGCVTRAKLIVSIMAGISTGKIEETLGDEVRVVRVMPNTPALVLQAASALAPGSHATVQDLEVATAIFDLLGKTYVVGEKLLDAVTGLSGSGPAYVYTLIEALADAGVKNGLARDVAVGLAAQTVAGSARMVLETGEHPAVLRDRVTSPGGTTIAGFQVLQMGRFSGTVMSAVDAATERSIELGKK